MLYIHGAAVITPRGKLEAGALLVQGKKIAATGTVDTLEAPSGAEKLDASGLVLAPGLIEIQLNGGFGKDFTEAPDALWEVAAKLPRYGITSFLPTVITSPHATVIHALEVFHQGPPPGWRGSQPLGFHLEGPMINPGKKGAHNANYIVPPSLEVIEGWTRQNGVVLVTLAPEQPGALEVVRALRARGVTVSAGHSLATYEQAKVAFEEGVTFGTHLFNAQPPLDHRSPGLAAALLEDSRIYAGLIPDGIHVHPGVVRLIWKIMGSERLVVVTDAMAAMGMPMGVYRLGDYEVQVDKTSARLADGTLAGSIVTLDQALRNLCAWTGSPLDAVLRCVTSTPARGLGLQGKGLLEAGADADLVLLTPEGYVVKTMVAGEMVYQAN